jgi:predicted RNA-binding Zn ribbon-like protein
MGLMTSPGRRWVWYGGRPSLDFVNTRRNREAGRRDAGAGDRTAGDGEAEYLREPADLAAWLAEAGLITPPAAGGRSPVVRDTVVTDTVDEDTVVTDTVDEDTVVRSTVDEDTLAGALALREAINTAVTATVAAVSVPDWAVRCVNEWIAAEPQRPALRLAAGVPVLSLPRAGRTPRGALALIAADAAELLGTGLRDRLRICPGPGCRGRFLDDSPAGRRRWCSMAVCGNRSKAAAHRQAMHTVAGTS